MKGLRRHVSIYSRHPYRRMRGAVDDIVGDMDPGQRPRYICRYSTVVQDERTKKFKAT